MVSTRSRLLGAGGVLLLVAAGCAGGGGGGDLDAFCKLVQGLDAEEAVPSADQLDKVAAAAPSEIKDDVKTLVGLSKKFLDDPEAAGEAFSDEKVTEAAANVEEFQAKECGTSGDDEEGEGADDEEATDDEALPTGGEGDLERFCEIAESDPDPETLAEWLSVAPPEIAANVVTVVAVAGAEAGGVDSGISESDLADATEAIDEFVAENC